MKFAASGWFSSDWYENVKAAAAHGFYGIEQLGWRNLDVERAVEMLEKYNMTNSALLIESVDNEVNTILGWKHGMVHEDARGPFIDAFRETVETALKFKTPNIVATTGNTRYDISREEQFKICVDTLKELAVIAEANKVTIVLEPLNELVDHKGYFLNTSKEAFEMVRAVNSPSVKVLFDIYHQQITEGNLIRNITENIDLIGHFHIADNPGRNQPGTGEINYCKVFEKIKEAGYNKWLAFECGTTLPTDMLCCQIHELTAPFEVYK